ncbi:uracil-DNA glycosylase [Lentisphaerota bacterium WC36G]|nr:uracil-DNA glycosylase [Lentisphaerae bacterium WC36]
MNLIKFLNSDWYEKIASYLPVNWFEIQSEFLTKEYKNYTIYPTLENIFNAFNSTKFSDVKVVILGQDPYHGENQAHGLSFSVDHSQKKLPPSLRNIFKELNDDLNIDNLSVRHGCLQEWTEQGVLLINAVLTVRASKPNSHSKKGWEIFTDAVIKALNDLHEQKIIFVLWGNFAQSKKSLINTQKHHVIESAHPSPLSARRGFFGSKVFSKINEILQDEGYKPINWQLKNGVNDDSLYVQEKLF